MQPHQVSLRDLAAHQRSIALIAESRRLIQISERLIARGRRLLAESRMHLATGRWIDRRSAPRPYAIRLANGSTRPVRRLAEPG